MREKLQTLPLTQLRELAKAQGIKGVTTLKKAEIIDRLCELQQTEEASVEPVLQEAQNKTEPVKTRTYTERKPDSKKREEVQKRDNTQRREDTQYQKGDEGQTQRREAPQYQKREDGQPQYQKREEGQPQYQKREEGQPQYQKREEGQPQYQKREETQSQRREESQSQTQRREETQTQRREETQTQRREETQTQRREETQYQRREDSQSRYSRYDNSNRDEQREGKTDFQELDSGVEANGILEVMQDGFGFIRCENFLPGEDDVYVAPSQIRRFNLKTGDVIRGSRRVRTATEKFAALLYINTINGYPTSVVERRPNFENLTPIFPNERLHMEVPGAKNTTAMRIVDLLSPIGKGQRGMIVSPPKAGKTTLLKQVAKAVTTNHPDTHLIILLIDERPEEVTDIKEAIIGPEVEVIYSTFDELPDRHKRVSEMVIERAKRLVEHGRDVMILLDSITRLARAYNLVVPPSGRTLSGGLDPAALHMPKRFFGAARNMREGGSLTILATALIETGSRMDDVIYEEFKGTGNMELVLDRKLSEKRIFPAIDILKSGTRRDDLLLTPEEAEVVDMIHKATNNQRPDESVERIVDLFTKTRSNQEFVEITRKRRYF